MPEMSGQPTLRKAVVFCVDEAYLPYALFLAQQLHQKEPRRDYDICLVSDRVVQIPDGFDELRLKVSPPLQSAAYDALKTTHLARSAYLRMWVPQILGQDYDRLIYLDSDIFADAAGLSDLFEIDMKGKAVAAVRDVQQWYRPRRVVKEFVKAGKGYRPYLNSGFLLIDVARYKESQVLERALAIAAAHPDWVPHHDQSLLNLALDGDWLELSPVWNWQWPWKYPLFTDWVGPRLLHFIGQSKPWSDPQGHCPRRFHLSYAAFLTAYFPLRAQVPVPTISVLESKARLFWLALRFVALRRALLRYLNRFPDPYQPRDAKA